MDFCAKMQSQARAALHPADSAEAAIRNADIVSVITSSREPVVEGSWLKSGCHINAAGSNWATKRELDAASVSRASLICVDHREQSRIESGDLIGVVEDWDSVRELSEVVRGKAGRRSPDEITIFKSNGIALEDVAAARYVYLAILEAHPQDFE